MDAYKRARIQQAKLLDLIGYIWAKPTGDAEIDLNGYEDETIRNLIEVNHRINRLLDNNPYFAADRKELQQ